jgi:hypothetical protein
MYFIADDLEFWAAPLSSGVAEKKGRKIFL